MATATASQPINMDGELIWDVSSIPIATSSQIRTVGFAGEVQDYHGNFSYDAYGDLTGGTLNSTTFTLNGIQQYTVSGLNHSAVTVFSYINAYNEPGLLKYLFNGNDVLNGSSGADIANAYGGNDSLHGNGANDIVRGGTGNDKVWGNTGGDTLNGQAGNDILYGGPGKDSLIGGTGNDKFVFDSAGGSNNADRITDFVHSADKIQLDNADFAGVGATGTLAQGKFFKGANVDATGANDPTDRVLYDTDSGKLYYDSDGNGPNGKVLIATVVGDPDNLAFSDIQVI